MAETAALRRRLLTACLVLVTLTEIASAQSRVYIPPTTPYNAEPASPLLTSMQSQLITECQEMWRNTTLDHFSWVSFRLRATPRSYVEYDQAAPPCTSCSAYVMGSLFGVQERKDAKLEVHLAVRLMVNVHRHSFAAWEGATDLVDRPDLLRPDGECASS
jgi:hypothetical protein